MDFKKPEYSSIDLSNLTFNGTSIQEIHALGPTGSTIDANIWTNTITAVDCQLQQNNSGKLEIQGENADIVVNGRSLMDVINKLEQRLNMLVPNPNLEAEWDELRELGERYRALESKCKEKGEMWNKLKSMPPLEIK